MIRKWFGQSASFRAFESALDLSGVKFLFMIRACPLMPMNLNNYLIGLTSLPVLDNVMGLIGLSIPLAFEVYIGTQLQTLVGIY